MASVSSANYLGVTIDTKLTFNNHLDHVCKKANSVLAFLCRNFRLCQHKIKSDVYLTYVRPILEYAVSVWAPHIKRSIYKLESIQRRAARFVMGDFQHTSSVTSMISSLNWTTLETHIKILRLVLFYKILNNHVDLLLPDYIMNSARVTRGNDRKFILPPMNIDAY